MNRTKTIAIFAGIFAIAMSTYGLSGSFASPMVMASIPQAQDGMGLLGHVEYTVLDSDQNVKAYLQADNVVVREGTDCAGAIIFGTVSDGACDLASNTFQYIGIGNGTADATEDDNELVGSSCALNSAGELSRKLVAPTITVPNVGAGTQVELDVGVNTFKFDAGNATTITQSGIFNAQFGAIDTTEPGGGMCATYGTAGTDWEMFAVQDLSGGVTVSAGDSLAVKWTITIS